MSKRFIRSQMRPALLLCVSLCASLVIGGGPTPAGSGKKEDELAAARNNPRSGAALNRDAARRAIAEGRFSIGGPSSTRITSYAVNDPSADATAQDTQSETTIADLGGGNLVAGFNDSGSNVGGAAHFTGFAYSSNNGVTWTDGGTLPASAVGDAGDPVLAYDKSAGALYFATLAFNGAPFPIQVFKSTDNGHTFAAPVSAGGLDADKPWLVVDGFAGGGLHNVYLCYVEFGVSPTEIRFTRSTDGGATFAPALTIAGGGTQVQGCFITVSPNHQVSVFYFKGTGASNDIFTRRSLDGGLTFQPEVQVAHLHTTSVNGDLGLLGGLRSSSFPHAGVNLIAGQPFLYVIFNDITVPKLKADIFIVRSNDGGLTWTAPIRVNDDLTGDQFMPTIALTKTTTGKLMIGYYSRSHDPKNLAFHRRGRLASVAANGVLTFQPSFQLSPDTPVVIGQDPVINATYMGDYDQIAGGVAFSSTWADNRAGNAFHARQPDVHFAQIAAAPAAADLSVSITRTPASIPLGQDVTFTVTATAASGSPTDVFLSVASVPGLLIQSVNAPGGQCTSINGFISCSLGTLAAATSRSIQIVATGILAAATRTLQVTGTTSSSDSNTANNTASAAVTVTNGSVVSSKSSTGNVAIPIADVNTTTVPLTVLQAGIPVRIDALVRLNHSFDGDLKLTLISPAGKRAVLSNRHGGGGDNYGSGPNDCTGTPTVFSDLAKTSISAGAPPFAGSFLPEEPLFNFLNDPMDGTWKLQIEDLAGGDTGTLGCFILRFARLPD